jgi:hypothetical protein
MQEEIGVVALFVHDVARFTSSLWLVQLLAK